MSKATRYLLVALAAGFMVSSAQAGMLSLVGVGNWSNLSVGGLPSGTTESTSTKFAPGGGALLDFHLGPGTSFQVGALYIQQKYDFNATISGVSGSGTIQQNYLQIPVLLRFRLLPMLSLGVGGYGERTIGSYTDTGTAALTAPPGTDFGLEGSAGLRLPLTMTTRLLIEGRYLYGLTNIAGSGTTANYRDVQAVVGLSFMIGRRGY